MQKRLLKNFSTTPPTPRPTAKPTPPPPPTHSPTPSPTPRPTPRPTPVPKKPEYWWNRELRGPWSQKFENHQCRRILTKLGQGSFRRGIGMIHKAYPWSAVRRRDSWRDNCIEASCNRKGTDYHAMTWYQPAWRDAGNWQFRGLCVPCGKEGCKAASVR